MFKIEKETSLSDIEMEKKSLIIMNSSSCSLSTTDGSSTVLYRELGINP